MDIGHNNPPGIMAFALETINELAHWLTEHPVIATEEDMREAKSWVDRLNGVFAELEQERHRKVHPLNEQVRTINRDFFAIHNRSGVGGQGDMVMGELKGRLTAYALAEEARRQAAADEAARLAREAVERAKALEEAEREARENARLGELTNVVEVATEAAKAHTEAVKAINQAERADRDAANVKIVGGFARNLSLRARETLTVTDPHTAFRILWPDTRIEEAMLSAARVFRKLHDELPDGIAATYERSV